MKNQVHEITYELYQLQAGFSKISTSCVRVFTNEIKDFLDLEPDLCLVNLSIQLSRQVFTYLLFLSNYFYRYRYLKFYLSGTGTALRAEICQTVSVLNILFKDYLDEVDGISVIDTYIWLEKRRDPPSRLVLDGCEIVRTLSQEH